MRGLTRMAFAVRGFYGEGTNAVGNLFQISNQATMGVAEGEIVEKLSEVTQQIMGYEKRRRLPCWQTHQRKWKTRFGGHMGFCNMRGC